MLLYMKWLLPIASDNCLALVFSFSFSNTNKLNYDVTLSIYLFLLIVLLICIITWIILSYLKNSRRHIQLWSFHLCLREATLTCKKFLDLHTSSTEYSSTVYLKHHTGIFLLWTMKLSRVSGILCRIKLKVWRTLKVV